MSAQDWYAGYKAGERAKTHEIWAKSLLGNMVGVCLGATLAVGALEGLWMGFVLACIGQVVFMWFAVTVKGSKTIDDEENAGD